MPRLSSLPQEKRLDVGSPVPIQSVSGAREVGDAIVDLGQTVMSAGTAFGKILQASEAEKQKLDLAAATEAADLAAMEAAFAAESNPDQAPDGSDRIKIYTEEYTKRASKIFESLPEGVRGQGSVVLQNSMNKQVDSIYRSMLNSREKYISNTDRQRFSMLVSNTYSNPDEVLNNIEKNIQALDSIELAYAPEKREFLKRTDAKAIANTAFSKLLERRQFAKARELLASPVAAYLDDDIATMGAKIQNAEDEARDKFLQDVDKSDRETNTFIKEQRDEIIGEIAGMLNSAGMDVAKKQKALQLARAYQAQGILKFSDINAIEKRTGKTAILGMSSPTIQSGAAQKLIDRTLSGDLTNINSQITEAVVNGQLDDETAVHLEKLVSTQRAILKKGGVAADRAVRGAATLLSQGKDVFPVNVQARMQEKVREAAMMGKDPYAAASTMLVSEAKKLKNIRPNLGFTSELVDMLYEQKTLKDFNTVDNLFQQRIAAMKNNPAEKQKVLALLKFYEQRRGLLSILDKEEGGR